MRKYLHLSLFVSLLALSACDKESPELIPCMCDPNADSTLGLFDCMCEPAKKRPVRRISYLEDKQKIRYQTLIIDQDQYNAYVMLHQSRDSFAPIKLENVDFRIKKNRKYDEYNTKLGDYRFRIFGCRRETKNAFLNQGRSMQKDMHFFDVFYETMNDYYPVVVDPSNVYYADSDKIPQAEYLLTAEITDYFMNICDEFDWDAAKSRQLRNGTSEMTVVWRVMNVAKDEVYCRGTTTGYGQILEGEPNGETLLAERAFEDALVKLPEISCFNQTLSLRIRPEDLAAQLARANLADNCPSCFATQYADELHGISMLQECQPACQEISCATAGGVYENHYEVSPDCRSVEIVEVGGSTVKSLDNVTISDDYFVDIPLEIDDVQTSAVIEEGGSSGTGSNADIKINEIGESSFATIDSEFCIVNNPPYENLNAHNLYKLRASIVSVKNSAGKKGAGLLIANNMVLTSADLIQKDNNIYDLETINGKTFKASAFRVNPSKNVAVLLLDRPTEFQPLPLSLDLPEVNKDILLTLGLLDFDEEGENYIDNEGRVVGYRWSEDKGAEIIVDTFVQTVTLGGALIDQKGNIIGIAHESKKSDNSPDLFIPIETALKSLGLEICGQKSATAKPKAVQIFTPIADAIDNSPVDKSPKPMSGMKRK